MTLFQKPDDTAFDALVAENRLIGDIQVAIETALADRKLSQGDLAKLMDVSPPRITQILGGNGANVTAKTVARIAHVLGLRACVVFTDPVVEDWIHEEAPDEDLARELADWVKVACEAIEEQGHIPTSIPSNDGWNANDSPNVVATGEDAEIQSAAA